MLLSQLVADLPVERLEAAVDPQVSGVAYDSRRVRVGDLFAAWCGEHADGRRFAPAAIEAGASAVLSFDRPLDDAPPVDVPWLVTERPRALLGILAARLTGHPERALTLLAVTGTNGKSTTVEIVRQIMQAAGYPTGTIGTMGYQFGNRILEGERTTPEGSDFIAVLETMRDEGVAAVAFEASSHALAQGRLMGIEPTVGAFLNLTRDHLDFHPDLEAYWRAKRSLFFGEASALANSPCAAVVSIDDPWGRRLADEIAAAEGPARQLLTFGEGADVCVHEETLDTAGIRAVIKTPSGMLPIESRLLGRFNLSNILAATAIAEALSIDHEAIAAGIALVEPIPGRMEAINAGQSFPVVVDYAHTPGALEAALEALRELSGKKTVLVFGCGGERDPGKRSLMGRVAGQLAEQPIVTDDNPRGEDPALIHAAIEEGLEEAGCENYRRVPDRREAIRRGIAFAAARSDGWSVLVAGKGHEDTQTTASGERPFSDRDEILEALEGTGGTAANR